MKGRAGTIGKLMLFDRQFSCVFMDSFVKLFSGIIFQESSLNAGRGA